MTRLKIICVFGLLCMLSHLSLLSGQAFIRGDVNGDGKISLSDAVTTLVYLFSDGTLTCLDAGDVNDSGDINVADAIYTLIYLFSDGPEPFYPFPECGVDPTPDDLNCDDVGDVCESGGENITISLGDTTLELVYCPPGTFDMGAKADEQDSSGCEKPLHRVTLTKGFYLGKYDVTKRQWDAVMPPHFPWAGMDYVLEEDDDPEGQSPAVYVSWHDAQAFIDELNELGQGTFRLPTEAEWEYACRAGTTERFYWGDDSGYTAIGNYAWYGENAWDVYERYAHRVGQKLPNNWGLYDMGGNVWEWCEDWFDEDYYSVSPGADPTGPVSGSIRVLRGGGWSDDAGYCRSAYRLRYRPGYTWLNIGFRVVLVPGQ